MLQARRINSWFLGGFGGQTGASLSLTDIGDRIGLLETSVAAVVSSISDLKQMMLKSMTTDMEKPRANDVGVDVAMEQGENCTAENRSLGRNVDGMISMCVPIPCAALSTCLQMSGLQMT